MEIDEIDLQDEQTSQVLLKYLNGEIPFHEWLNLQSSGCSDGNSIGVDNTAEDDINEIAEYITDVNTTLATVTAEVITSDKGYEEDGESSSTELFHPSISKFPKKMTELLLMGNKQPATKSVDEFMDEIPITAKKKRRIGRRRLNELSKEQRYVMGEINMCCVRKDFDKAWNLCEDLIQKAPRCPEPFQVLAFICEEKKDPEKAHQYKLIAAHLGTADCEEWVDLAQWSIKNENWQEALVCFNEACKKTPDNIDFLMAKATLYDNLNQPKKKMEVFDNILRVLPKEEGSKYFVIAKDIAQLYHEMNEDEKAILALDNAFKKYPHLIKFEDVNILTELYMSLRKFQKAFQVICQYCNVQFLETEYPSSLTSVADALTEEDLMEEKLTDIPFNMSEPLPVDLRAKLIVCLIQSNAKHERIQDVISSLFLEPIEEVGDLYLDIVDAYCENGQYEEALVLLNPLVKTEQFGQAAVWLKKAECLSTLGKEEDAAEAYSQVVFLAPGHSEARFTLSALYRRLGQADKALTVLEEMPRDANDDSVCSDEDNEVEMENDDQLIGRSTTSNSAKKIKPISHQELKLLYHRSLLLYSQKEIDGFLSDGIQALSHYFSDVYYDDQMLTTSLNRSLRFAILRMRKLADDMPESLKEAQGSIVADIRREEWWDLLVKVAKTLCKVERFPEMEYIIKCAMSSARFAYFRGYQCELDYLGVTACYINGSLDTAFNIIRVVINRKRDCKHLWNIFTRLIVGSGDSKHQKFCLRQLLKDPESYPLQMVNGHNALMSGNYKYALGEYARAFRQKPHEPMVSLLVGLSYLQIACQKFTFRRNSNIVQAFLFFYQYENLRGRCQETDYNLGRGYHQLGLFHFASHYYHKVLEYTAVGDEEEDEEFWEKNNLHREAAFNLSLIYRYSGNTHVARELLRKYCTI